MDKTKLTGEAGGVAEVRFCPRHQHSWLENIFPLNDDNLRHCELCPLSFFFPSGKLPFALAFAIVRISKFDSIKPNIILQEQTGNQSKPWLVVFEINSHFKQEFRESLEVYMSSSVAKSFLSNFKRFPEQERNSLKCQTSWHIPHAQRVFLLPK